MLGLFFRYINRGVRKHCLAFALLAVNTTPSFALFLDGGGHYSIRAERQTNPGTGSDRGTHQALEQSFRLEGEARANDKSSFFLEFRLFDHMKDNYLGDEARPHQCANGNQQDDCRNTNQNTSYPGYKNYTINVSKAYMRYAFDYCLLEAGRRGRDWGLGVFLDSGKRPFSKSMSVFDGVTCDFNIQKFQNLGFSFGVDSLAETGVKVPNSADTPVVFGASNGSDDIYQYFLTIDYDERKMNSASGLAKQIGIYAAKIQSGSVDSGGLNADLSFLDIFTGFFFPSVTIRNELIFRLGKTADPSTLRLGGGATDKGNPAVNDMQAIAIAGGIDWTFSGLASTQSSGLIKQEEYSKHVVFFEYAFAPGDSDGYFTDLNDDKLIGIQKRKNSAKAFAFHPNFKPALILFNAHSDINNLKVDGVFEPDQIVNAQVYSLGYRYEDSEYGNFESRGIYASLNEGIPNDAYDYYKTKSSRPVGFAGNDLGFELDLKYWTYMTEDVEVGTAVAGLFPGSAWKVSDDKPKANILFQAFLGFKF